jgi:hypothetical protein
MFTTQSTVPYYHAELNAGSESAMTALYPKLQRYFASPQFNNKIQVEGVP